MEIELREMDLKEIWLIEQVDRSERVEAKYVADRSADGMGLSLRRVPKDPPGETGPWGKRGVEARINLWRPKLEKGGVMLGAFDRERLVGFGILGPKLRDGSAELCAIFVDTEYRRSGIGSRLMGEIEMRARERGVSALSIGSNPTASAVEFYLKHGCKVITLSDNSLIKHRPGDPVFAKEL